MTFLRLSLLLLAFPSLAAAAPTTSLDPQTAAPYTWRVAVRFDPHPSLTAAYRARVLQDIKAALHSSLGEVGRLDVVDLLAVPEAQRDPLSQKFLAEGWPALDAAEFRQLSDVKTHFVRIGVKDALFRIEARQHDGLTGLASPVTRTRETASPETVGRLAGLMLDREFGPVGTVELIPGDRDHVRVRFRGSALAGFDRYVKPGDVFAVAVVRERTVQPPAEKGTPKRGEKRPEPTKVLIGQPREYTLLRSSEQLGDGAWKCDVLTRFTNPFQSGPDVAGYRCLKLATADAPVRVRVLDSDGKPQVGNQLLQVRGTDRDFAYRLEPRDGFELRDGVFRSTRPLRNVACITLGIGSSRAEPFPIPVLGDGIVTVRFAIDPEEVARAAFERECEDLRGRVAEVRTAQLSLLQSMTALLNKGRNGEALERAEASLKTTDAMDKDLTAELERLKGQALAAEGSPSLLLRGAQDQLALVRVNRGSIADKAKQLQEHLAKSNGDAKFEKEFRAKELTSRIRELIAVGEVPEALDAYDLLVDLTKDEELKKKRDQLAQDWKPRGMEHEKARNYVTAVWPAVSTLDEFKAAQEPLADAVDAMAKHTDRLGLRKLIASFEPAYAQLKTILDKLDQNSETDRAAVKELKAVADALRKLETRARDEVKKLEGTPVAGS